MDDGERFADLSPEERREIARKMRVRLAPEDVDQADERLAHEPLRDLNSAPEEAQKAYFEDVPGSGE